ncbi:hypothetical protein [Sphingomonas sp. LM7]|uniref:hypothetical protein n=1 Tax=Sphingomonas sp. LM7 TaxID=1938607 RepID=UPI000983D46F|nr:hypothetical protein [Sphingomonas sp. LM7]AQR73112.1 hypothetical protein BXU08_04955 [Sphingomonas sp. LM7]
MFDALLAAALLAHPAPQASALPQIATGDPELAIIFVNALPEVCFRATRGASPATDASLKKLAAVPDIIASDYGRFPTWFSLAKRPNNVFVGFSAEANDCHLVLADTTQTVEVQKKVIAALTASGFRAQQDARSKGMTDMIFVSAVPDGYILVSLQAPLAPVEGGKGAQGAVHVRLISKAAFEAR